MTNRSKGRDPSVEFKNESDEGSSGAINEVANPSLPSEEAPANEPMRAPTSPMPPPPAFDPARLRRSQDFAVEAAVKKTYADLPVGKPPRQTFFRVHPDPEARLYGRIIDLKEEREIYLVDPALFGVLAVETSPVLIHYVLTRQNVPYLWPIKLPGPDGRMDRWTASAHLAAQRAMVTWTRMNANMSLGAYEIIEAVNDLGPADWPAELPFDKALELGFRDRYINSLDHPVVRRLRGEGP